MEKVIDVRQKCRIEISINPDVKQCYPCICILIIKEYAKPGKLNRPITQDEFSYSN